MGCAFSSTQIFVIDPDRVGNIRGIVLLVRRGLARSRRKSKTADRAFWLASKNSTNDVVLVGKLKSNGVHCRRRPSSEARFIEHRSRLSPAMKNAMNGGGDEEKDRREGRSGGGDHTIGNNSHKMGASRRSGLERANNVSHRKASQRSHQPHFGLMDFQRRLDLLKTRRPDELGDENEKERNNEEEREEDRPILLNEKNKGKGTNSRTEPQIVNHIVAMEMEGEGEDNSGEQQRQLMMADTDGEVWREWDELSAECSSIQIGSQQQSWHDGISEASFVLVKKRLKVAWEQHQIIQIRRKHSQLRREGGGQQQQRIADARMNNWMPEIAQEED